MKWRRPKVGDRKRAVFFAWLPQAADDGHNYLLVLMYEAHEYVEEYPGNESWHRTALLPMHANTTDIPGYVRGEFYERGWCKWLELMP